MHSYLLRRKLQGVQFQAYGFFVASAILWSYMSVLWALPSLKRRSLCIKTRKVAEKQESSWKRKKYREKTSQMQLSKAPPLEKKVSELRTNTSPLLFRRKKCSLRGAWVCERLSDGERRKGRAVAESSCVSLPTHKTNGMRKGVILL